MTKQESSLASALGWRPLAIPTGEKRGSGYPTCYKVDVGDLASKVAIEVDGKSHLTAKRKAQDRKKESMLLSLGWLVLRFTNERVDADLVGVVEEIRSASSSR